MMDAEHEFATCNISFDIYIITLECVKLSLNRFAVYFGVLRLYLYTITENITKIRLLIFQGSFLLCYAKSWLWM